MKQQFPEMRVEKVVQPARGAAGQRDGPVNCGETAIAYGREAREVMQLQLRS